MNNYRCMTLKKSNHLFQCNYCGNITEIIWVHGHGQCAHCKTNIDECCRGENVSLSNIDDEKQITEKKHE
jgi:hypothetical protein